MKTRITPGKVTEPANRGLRLLFVLLAGLLLAACASSPQARPAAEKPAPLVDRTADTDYDLEPVVVKLSQARAFERDGKRQLAELTLETADTMLPKDHARERGYLQVVKATIWAREGEGRDARKARALLDGLDAADDGRLLADALLARVVLLLGDGDKVGAARAGDEALRALAGVEAHTRAVEAARDLAFQFLDADDPAAARSFARRAERDAKRLDDDRLLVQTCLDVARIELNTGADPEPALSDAYEAAYRLNDLGWRNVVVALAVDSWYGRSEFESCVRWGNRLRDYDEGRLPALVDSELYPEDYITLLAQYALAVEEVEKSGPRGQEARRLALAAIQDLSEEQRAEWSGLAEKLSAGLLNPAGEK